MYNFKTVGMKYQRIKISIMALPLNLLLGLLQQRTSRRTAHKGDIPSECLPYLPGNERETAEPLTI